MKVAFFNLLFRSLAMGGRLFILIGIGKFFTVADLGIYGLFHATIMIALYFIGFDFYAFNTRELIAGDIQKRLPLIRDQFIFHFFSYLIIFPLLISVFLYNIIPSTFIIWFYVILLLEHVSQELFRIFTAVSKSIFANFITFLKSGIWVYVLWVFWLTDDHIFRSLEHIWIAWSTGLAVSCIAGLIYLFKLNFGSIRNVPVNWQWIIKGIKISLPFFISTIAYKLIEFSNRYFIDFYLDKNLVGIYTFYNGIANLINIVIFTGIIMIIYPKLYEFYIKEQIEKFRIEVRKFTIFVSTGSIIMGILVIIFIGILLKLIGKEGIYTEYLGTYYILVISNVILNLSLIPHYLMYIRGKDKMIMYITLTGAIINIILNFILIQTIGIEGAALSAAIALFIIMILKYIYRGDSNHAGI